MPAFHALLLTDVVDSTKLTEELGDAAMAQLWIAHDRVARDLLPLWRGREIDKTDGMLLLFDAVGDAVNYALAYHRRLAAAEMPFKARAGIHVGPVALRPNPADDVARGAKPVEVDGLALPITARVMSVALGAQTLLSADARLALGVATQRVLSHGHWRMHGVADPVELFEIGEAGAPFIAPPDGAKVYRVMRQGDLWQPVREVRHSVPAERDSFVGRQEPLRLIAKKLEEGARLISVLGIGGTGKTRLVTRFAWTHLGEYPGGVWFCDLSQARTLDGIHFAVAQGLDVPLGKTDPVVQLAHAIAGRGECLVILDNFEQVARHAEETLGLWLERAPLARFVVTTREVLGIVGEEMLVLATMSGAESAALFLRRAESARHGYAPTAVDTQAIAQLVTVLDGLPLAIELAAARMRVMAPSALLGRMNERFNVLLSRTGRYGRQATLRAAFDWSWDLLMESEKATLAQLSVFEGGFTMDSASAVVDLGGAPSSAARVSEVIEWLVDKSLVRQVSDSRFDLLESVREYAAEHLRSDGRYAGSGAAAAAAAQERHWIYFSALDDRAAAANRCAEANNLVAACRRATASGHAASATATLSGAWAALKLCGPYRIALQLADAVAALEGLESTQRSAIDWIAASASSLLGDLVRARRHIEPGLARSRLDGEPLQQARFLCALGELPNSEGDTSIARQSLDLARQMARDLGDSALLCRAINALGTLSSDLGQPEAARVFYEDALAVARASQDEHWEGGLLGNLATVLHAEGRLDEAKALYEPALKLAVHTGDRRWEGNTRCNLGLLLHEQGRQAEACTQFEAVLEMARPMGYQRLVSTALCNLGMALEAQGQMKAAEVRYEEAVSLAADLGERRAEGQFRGYLGLLLARTGKLKEGVACLDLAESCLGDSGDELSLGLLLCQRVAAARLSGSHEDASIYLRRAESLALRVSLAPESEFAKALTVAQGETLTDA